MAAVDREKLYEQVWTIPGSRLAPLYGISDVALAKVCKRYKIPRPPRGYWAKFAAGQTPARKPLAKLLDDRYSVVQMQGWEMPDDAFELNAIAPDEHSARPCASPEELSSPHELIVAARTQLATEKPDRNGLLRTDAETAVDARVSPASVARCLSLYETLIGKWEERGGTVRVVRTSSGSQTALTIGDDEVFVSIYEEVDDEKPLSDSTRLTGRLCAQLYGNYLRRKWGDKKKQRVEKVLSTLVTTAIGALSRMRAIRLDAECVKRQQRRAEERREAVVAEKDTQFGRRHNLMQYVNRWYDSQRIRGYLSALQTAIDDDQVQPVNDTGFHEWFEWATWYADSIDPILQAPHPDKQSECPMNTAAADLDLTTRARAVITELHVKDSDELAQMPSERIEEACGYHVWDMREEVHRVLEGLGYPRQRK